MFEDSLQITKDLSTATVLVILLAVVSILVVVLTIVWNVRLPGVVNPGIRAVLITGCDRGFGFLAAKQLDAMNFKVFAGCLDAEGEAAKNLEQETSPRLHILQLDVTNDKDIEAARLEITESLMGNVLWALINNAGVPNHASFEWCPASRFDLLINVNFMGVVRMTRAFLPLIRAAKGRIINVASLAGRTALPGFTAYSASKSAVIGFSESLRREMAHFDVKVILIEPPIYRTDFTSADVILPQNQQFWDQAESGIKRDYGEMFFNATQKSQESMLKWANPRVENVIQCMVDAVSSTHPRSRYTTSIIGMMNDVMNLTSNGLQDRIIRLYMGVNSKPAIVNPLLNVEPTRNGRRRSHAL